VIVAVAAALLFPPLDERLFHLLYAAQHGALTSVAAAFSALGEGWIILGLLPLLFVKKHRADTAALLAVLAATAVLVAGLKLAVHRVRPCNALAGVSCLSGAAPHDYSFPSGHAAGSFAFATFLASLVLLSDEGRDRRAAQVAVVAVALVVAACIALSRVYLGVHFPFDVAAGSALGALLGLAGARLHVGARRKPEQAPSRAR
jgi:undecaprenyl-diphosphatase